MQNFWHQYRIHALLVMGAFALGFLAAMTTSVQTRDTDDQAIREYDTRYQFIHPLLICQVDENEEAGELTSLDQKVGRLINASQDDGKIISASVYYRDLNSNRWMGVNELELYEPASLLKVPIMMTYLKQVGTDPDILETVYPYELREEAKDKLVQKPILVPNKSYTVLDLIRGMIIQSDNSAKDILEEHADQKSLDQTYHILGLKDPYESESGLYQLSTKSYALFFRVLYNGTYLGRRMSNTALQILSESEFVLGLRAGTPENIAVAHKYGVRGLTESNGTEGVELSDCGIVYHPDSPYLLCVMTHGTDPYVLAGVIKDVAETVYKEI
ncbi:MAG: serine hydrolase [Candidatus Pacebacteria bacterium]|nr:serine hydrolase [Candidatus Paceibacterota bacterium]